MTRSFTRLKNRNMKDGSVFFASVHFQFPKKTKEINLTSRCFMFEESETGPKKLMMLRFTDSSRKWNVSFSYISPSLSGKSEPIRRLKNMKVDERNIASFAVVIGIVAKHFSPLNRR